MYGTFWALVPPILAIVLALITKETYSSLFVGIVVGAGMFLLAVAGSIIIEQVFTNPGIGRLLLLAISNRDYPVVQSIVVIIAFVVVFMNFLADIANQFIDPRIRLS